MWRSGEGPGGEGSTVGGAGARTLVELLRARALGHPDRRAYTFLRDGEPATPATPADTATYAELDRRARALAARLQSLGLAGERALLLFPPGLEFIHAFLGCLYAGVVAVPSYPPRGSRGLPRLQAVLADSRPRAVLTHPSFAGAAGRLAEERGGIAVLTLEEGDAGAEAWVAPEALPDGLAFLQYTSGSTSRPKGVAVTHRNLLANQRMIGEAFGAAEESVVVSWLPLYHDMGLIGGVLHPLYLGARCVLLPPVRFLQKPLRWLEAISAFRADVSGGPNFAYELCAERVTPQEREGLDLSCWRVAFNGAEPVRAATLEAFSRAFAPAGFRRAAFFPCYGLAEATLIVSGGKPARAEPEVRAVSAAELERGRAVAPVAGQPVRQLVSSGRIADGVTVRVVDPATGRALPPGAVGEVWVAGESVAAGYWGPPEDAGAAAEAFGARLDGEPHAFLRTGDLGFVPEEEAGGLFVTGRIKDLVILRGRNLYPHDVEATVERSHPALRPGCGAAFAVDGENGERLVVVQEVEVRQAEAAGWEEVAAAVRRAVAGEHEARVEDLVLVRPGGVPKTTSGKIQRRACRELFLSGGLEAARHFRMDWQAGGSLPEEAGAAPRTPPATAAEEAVALAWAEVLGLDPGGVAREDDFLAAGGDSLRGVRLLGRLAEGAAAFPPGIELSLEDLFEAPTVAALAARLEAAREAGGAALLPPVEPAPRGGALPLSYPQRRLWFLDRLEPGNPAYNLPFALRFSGPLRPEALARSLAAAVARHESLRTRFEVVGPEPAQVVEPPGPVPLPCADLSGLPEGRRGAEAERLAGEEGAARFDLTRLPLLRAVLLRRGPADHELLLTIHHIAADGWSLGVLLRDLAGLYSLSLPSLPPLPVQYADFAVAQRRFLDSGALAPQLAAWRERLAGLAPVLELPADRPAPPVRGFRGGLLARALPPSDLAALRAAAGARGASLFMALLAGFGALLHRITGRADLAVGTAVANRPRPELEPLVGFFVNTLPLRLAPSGRLRFSDLLAAARAETLGALSRSAVPFELLVDELKLERSLSHTPLVQVMLVLQNEPLAARWGSGLELSGREVDNGTARFDLALSFLEGPGGLEGTFRYSCERFDAATVHRLAGHLVTLLAAAAAGPERALEELPLLTEAERQQARWEWNDSVADWPDGGRLLQELILERAEKLPESPALVFEGESLSYRELAQRAGKLAAFLQRLGVAPDTLVGVAVERSLDLPVALLGVLRAGGAYVPLDPSYPRERLAWTAADARLEVVLTQRRLAADLDFGAARPVLLDTGWEEIARAGEPRDPRELGAGPDSLAYAIYTSGSTGRPKGALLSHRGIVNRLLWMQREYGLEPGEGVLQKTPAGFDVSVWEFFWPLIAGARLVLARPGGHQDSAYLTRLIEAERVTTLHFVPSMLQVFLEDPGLGRCGSLRRVIASGEALPADLQERFFARWAGIGEAGLHNLYGPTEASVDVTFWPCRPAPAPRGVPIGRPVANTAIWILDRAGLPAPAGVPGELCIGGVQLARGYLGRPELTAERFVPDPFGEPGGRLYRTGDLARWRPDGAVEFLGRLDHQVKIRGHRVEPGEVEAALTALPGVREAVVLARAEPGSGTRLVAYWVGTPEDSEGLAAALRQRLPEPMIPAAFVKLDALPLNPSGKVDRRALPAPDAAREPEREKVAPRTETERRLVELWAGQLGIAAEALGVEDDFFALGGDSIQGALLINRLQRELGAVLYVMALFEAPTVARFSAYLETQYAAALAAAGWLEGEEKDKDRKDFKDGRDRDSRDEEAEAARLREHLRGRFSAALPAAPAERAGRVVFLLSPFRSGSTLLRVLLAGHPRLFAPPELELLGFATMAERERAFAGRDRFSREGLVRAVMELFECGPAEAEERIAAAAAEDGATPAFYRRLQEWAGGRLLVDKTPRYALDRATLDRAETWFEEPLYVHLVRHPCATIASYLEARMDQAYRFPLPPLRQAEQVWRLAHENILDFLAGVPAGRRVTVHFEDLVREPRPVMESLCRFLGIGFDEALLDPYQGPRMTDGLHGAGRMMGDPKFHTHRRIEPAAADRWRDRFSLASLGPASRRLAGRLGYALEEDGEEEPGPAGGRPLSFAQQRLWFLDRLEPGSATYNMPAAVRLRGTLDAAALACAFAEVERRHEVLRTAYPDVAGRPRLEVRPPRAVPIQEVDLRALPAGVRGAEVERRVRAESRRPFDLAHGPVLRATLLRTAADERLLLVTLHHIAADGWSVGILVREVAALYAAATRGEPSPLPELPLQYSGHAARERRRLSGETLARRLAAVRERLPAPLPVLELPTDRPRPPVQTYRGSRVPLALPAAELVRLREWARREGTTLFPVLLSGFAALLGRIAVQDDLLIGTPAANRHRAEVEGLIGLFVNTLPVRVGLAEDPTAGELLRRSRAAFLAAAADEDLPFEKLVEELAERRSLAYPPLVQALLALQNAPASALALPGLEAAVLEVDNGTAKLDLLLSWTEQDGVLTGFLEVNADLFDRATAGRLTRQMTVLLGGLADGAGTPCSALSIFDEAERHQLLAEWNDTAAGEAEPVPLHGFFERQAARTPDAVALRAPGEEISYAELERRSGRLARRLAGLGVGPEVRVGVLLERSPRLVEALLGVLRAGGAYVPLDPAYPRERLGFMLEDAGARVILTEEPLLGLLPGVGEAEVVCLEDGAPSPTLPRADARERAPAARPVVAGGGEVAPGGGALSREEGEGWGGGLVLPSNLAYLIYTSGSTGRPKAVAIPHASAAALLRWAERAFSPAETAAVLASTSVCFDLSVFELFVPLGRGGTVVLARTALDLADPLTAAGVTLVNTVPSAMAEILRLEALPDSAGTVCLAGEPLPPALAAALHRRAPGCRLLNLYGPSEDTTYSTTATVEPGRRITIGRPLDGTRAHVLDAARQPVPAGVPGELCLSGAGLARGYLGRPDLTAERFLPDPLAVLPGERMYRTGDLVRRLADGRLDYLGRLDRQVKLRGFRIELGEVEAALVRLPGIAQAAALVREDRPGDRRLTGYVVPAPVAPPSAASPPTAEGLRQALRESLPDYMVPSQFVVLEALPLTPNGKVDRAALPAPDGGRPDLAAAFVSPRNEAEREIAAVWQEVLGVERVGVHDNFFDLGGHSLLAVEVHSRLRERLQADLPLAELLQYPTVHALAGRLRPAERAEAAPAPVPLASRASSRLEDGAVAVVGMAGRFPGAPDLETFWRNLRDGVDGISRFSDEQLLAAGEDPAQLADPRYVRARGVLDGIERFDAAFFNIPPREAATTDPQHRVFLECAWEALEDAGCDASAWPGRIGVYAGSLLSTYLLFHLFGREAGDGMSDWQTALNNDRDTLATRVSYKLNLRGPGVTVQTACSTSLVAVHMACRSLLARECDLALAGGVAVRTPQQVGYLYQEQGILSPDGRCRAFDAAARGTVFGSGAGVVALKRLEDALADGDAIRAVIRGTAINNDGAAKPGFTAPGVDGQAEVVARALEVAGVPAETLGYVEAHGTGTPLGDPIEVAALTRAFRASTARRGFCALGSVKSNVGHLDAAAGVAGLIKTVLALERREIPPTLHFERPNPAIDFAGSPFRVASRRQSWVGEKGVPRRAGVSAFGIGGTNAHAVLEEAPPVAASGPSRPWQLLTLSARTLAALDRMGARLAGKLREAGDDPAALADAAWTLQTGRRRFEHRWTVICRDAREAVESLESGRGIVGTGGERTPVVAFLFPGQGAQRPGMGRELYAGEPVFRAEIDRSAEILRFPLGKDLRSLLFPPAGKEEAAASLLARTEIAQPALLAFEVALARLWMAWGVRPAAMLGHSLGEYTAACLAGVFSLEDALALVAARGRMMQALPEGAMLAVPLPEPEAAALLEGGLALAAVNAAAQCVISGPADEVAALRERLAGRGIEARSLATSHAFHSAAMDPVLEPFLRRLGQVRLSPPRIPYLSNLTGTWIRPEQATDPAYWAEHLRRTVRFGDGLAALLAEPDVVPLEVGPGRALANLARRHPDRPSRVCVASLRPEALPDDSPEPAALLEALGRLWIAGVDVDWRAFSAGERRRRVPLPTYPFERERHWIEPVARAAKLAPAPAPAPSISRPAILVELPEGEGMEGIDPAAIERALAPLFAGRTLPRISLLAPEPQANSERPLGNSPDGGSSNSLENAGLAYRIAAVWREVLGVAAVAPTDSFLGLGGDSLVALQAVARLRRDLGIDVPVRLLFESPDLEGLAAVLERQTAAPEAGAPPPIHRRAEGPAPLSFSQRRLWFLDQMEPGDPSLNLLSAVRLTGRLDAAALGLAFAALLDRHEILRTGFQAAGGVPVQVVHPEVACPLPEIDLSALPAALREAEADRLAQTQGQARFALAAAPLVRAWRVRLQPGEQLLLVTMHHIVADGWSLAVWLREAAALYAAYASGRQPSLPELPVQYGDFAVWQREWLQGDVLERQLAYWRGRLVPSPPPLDLPADRPRPAVLSRRGGHRARSLGTALENGLRELGRGRGASLFMVLHAGLAALLHRFTGRHDLALGTATANRRRVELEGLLGCFVNTLVLRTGLAPDLSFADLLERVREADLGAFQHQDFPFERLVDELRPERDLSRPPLFSVLFILQNTPAEEVALDGLRLEARQLGNGTAQLDLSLSMAETGAGLAGTWTYARDLFDAVTVDRLAAGLERLLAAAVAAPESRLGDLGLLSAAERHQLLHEWSDTAAPVSGRCVHELLAAAARERPDAVAVADGTVTWTCAELEWRADALAARLRGLGVGPETLVGVALPRSANLLAALLAVWKAGGAYVPVDPDYPRERVAWMLEDAAAPVLLTEERLLASLPAAAGTVLCLDRPTDGGEPAVAAPAVHPGNLAYVIYTSGSTGRPKGVQIPHGALANFLGSMRRTPGLGPDGAVLAVTSLSFDIAALELFLPLLAGGRVEIADRDTAADGALLRARLESSGATVMQATPATWKLLLEAGWADQRLRAFCGGESLAPGLAAALLPRVRELWNLYGPTETTVWSSLARVEPGAPVSLGRPIANTAVRLLGPDLSPVPPGAAGELCIGGAGLARGYRGRPDLTAERFIPDPLGDPGARLYRAGDLARLRRDGTLEGLGRIDHQVKIRGFRIELGEVEAAVARHPAVREAVAVVREDAGGPRLVAYLTAAGEAEPAELRRWTAEILPAYMVPSAFVAVEAFPLTPNGKVDRRALARSGPLPEATAPTARRAPATPTEELLAGLWAEVLGRPEVPLDESFFDLGGHSLLAARLAARIREAFGVELPLRRLFEAPTVAGLARAVEAAQREGAAALPGITPVPREGGLPLSFAQQRLWVLDRFEEARPAYNLPGAVRLSGLLDPAVLARAFDEVVRRHEILRTAIREGAAGAPAQIILPPEPGVWPLADLAALPPAARAAERERLAAGEAARPFDLGGDRLLRALLIREAPEEHLLSVVLHHIAADGGSLPLLIRELAALYGAGAAGQPSPLPELPVQYADYAAWQRRALDGDGLAALLEPWRRRLEGVPPRLDLPADRPRPAAQSYRGGVRPVALSRELSDGLAGLSRRQGATLFMTLAAAFAALLGRLLARRDPERGRLGEDLLLGTAVAGRHRRELEGLIGLFVNTLPLRADLSGAPSFGELVSRLRGVCLDAYAGQDLPFERLVDELAPRRDLSAPPLVQVMLVLQDEPFGAITLPGLTLAPVPLHNRTAKLDWTLHLFTTPRGLEGHLEYAADLFDAPTVERSLRGFEHLLRGAVADPGRRLSDLPLLAEAERHQITVEWNDSRAVYPGPAGLHELIERQAARTPDAPAVVFAGTTLSYAELDARAGDLAGRLRGLGVGPEVPVGVFLERSVELVVSLLAVLKAGGAYLPLDPGYPAERLSALLEDAAVPLVLSSPGLAAALPASAARVLEVEGERDIKDLRDLKDPRDKDRRNGSPALPGQAAYVIFTSGSTGRPKGAVNTHEAIRNRLLWMQAAYRLEPGDRVLQKTPFSFDVSVWELFWPLLAGATLVVARPEGHRDPSYLVRLIQEERVSVLHFVPSMLGPFLDEPGAERCTSLRQVFCSGEALPFELQERFFARLAGARLDNLYGPTEAAVDVTFWACRPGGSHRSVPIGRPVANTLLRLLDPGLRPVPAGVPGELYLGGIQLARGYFARPALTAERFVPDPLAEEPGARLYRTGDLARLLPDGAVDFLGRVDFQVKIRGFRIELEEIEAALAAHPGLRAAAVAARADGPGERRLVAYVVADGEMPAVRELRAFLASRLPAYMVPALFVPLAALPLSPNGKADRRALPAPEAVALEERGSTAARTPAEETLAGIWARVLGRDRIGVDDNFFELGGDSILGIQTVNLARQAGLVIAPRDLFRHQTVAELAALAEATAATPERAEGAAFGPVPLTPIQRWLLDRPADELPEPHWFNQSLLLETRGPLAPERLAAALAVLATRHDALRLRFEKGAGGWRQEALPAAGPAPCLQIDLAALPEERRAAAWQEAAAAVQGSLDLGRPPLLRAALCRLGDGAPGRLLLVLHHLIVDGVSWRVLLEELDLLLSGRPLPARRGAGFARWAAGLDAYAATEAAMAELPWWLEALPGRGARLPADFPGGANLAGSEISAAAELSAEETRELLEDVPALYHTRPHEPLLAALLGVLTDWTGERALRLDLEGHGREDLLPDLDVSRTVGWLTALYPVLLKAPAGADPGERLKAVKERLRAVPHGGAGYGVLRHLAPEENAEAAGRLRELPASEILFNYLGRVDRGLPDSAWLAPAPAPGPGGPAAGGGNRRSHPLEIRAEVAGGRLRASFLGSRSLHRPATLAALAEDFLAALRDLLRHVRNAREAREAGSAEFTPSDFPEARLSQRDLDKLTSRLGRQGGGGTGR